LTATFLTDGKALGLGHLVAAALQLDAGSSISGAAFSAFAAGAEHSAHFRGSVFDAVDETFLAKPPPVPCNSSPHTANYKPTAGKRRHTLHHVGVFQDKPDFATRRPDDIFAAIFVLVQHVATPGSLKSATRADFFAPLKAALGPARPSFAGALQGISSLGDIPGMSFNSVSGLHHAVSGAVQSISSLQAALQAPKGGGSQCKEGWVEVFRWSFALSETDVPTETLLAVLDAASDHVDITASQLAAFLKGASLSAQARFAALLSSGDVVKLTASLQVAKRLQSERVGPRPSAPPTPQLAKARVQTVSVSKRIRRTVSYGVDGRIVVPSSKAFFQTKTKEDPTAADVRAFDDENRAP